MEAEVSNVLIRKRRYAGSSVTAQSLLLPFTYPVVRFQQRASSVGKAIITSRPYPTDMGLNRTSYSLLSIQYQLLAVTIHIPYLRLNPTIDSSFCRRKLEVVRH